LYGNVGWVSVRQNVASVENVKAVVAQNPDALFFRGEVKTSLKAWVCGVCGYTELYAKHPAALLAVHSPPALALMAIIVAPNTTYLRYFNASFIIVLRVGSTLTMSPGTRTMFSASLRAASRKLT
jgi:hypothetical protein